MFKEWYFWVIALPVLFVLGVYVRKKYLRFVKKHIGNGILEEVKKIPNDPLAGVENFRKEKGYAIGRISMTKPHYLVGETVLYVLIGNYNFKFIEQDSVWSFKSCTKEYPKEIEEQALKE